jgi:hypothetical protein
VALAYGDVSISGIGSNLVVSLSCHATRVDAPLPKDRAANMNGDY